MTILLTSAKWSLMVTKRKHALVGKDLGEAESIKMLEETAKQLGSGQKRVKE
jgi:hypothetical protein